MLVKVGIMQPDKLQTALEKLLPGTITVLRTEPVSGGCISEAARATVRDSNGDARNYFVKRNSTNFLRNFQCERNGLAAIEASGTMKVPSPIAVGLHDDQAWLVLEWVEHGKKGTDFFTEFGKQLAELHRCTRSTGAGWEEDNYLGATIQSNSPMPHWVEFFAEHRIEAQLKLAVDHHRLPKRVIESLEKIIRRMDRILAGSESDTSLLHGDLWSGNYLADECGNPVLIDPAVYRGNREAEFGMLKLFGGCPDTFYEAYDGTYPLAAGWERRNRVYILYHLLNHLNLFGSGYLSDCEKMAARILSESS